MSICEKIKRIQEYVPKFIHGEFKSGYKWGFLYPKEVQGYFTKNDHGTLQESFFYGLLEMGYKRTWLQLILPGQTASLIKDIGDNWEHHIRFYDDGTIDLEVEYSRLSLDHWSNEAYHSTDILSELLDKTNPHKISEEDKTKIKTLFGIKKYSDNCRKN